MVSLVNFALFFVAVALGVVLLVFAGNRGWGASGGTKEPNSLSESELRSMIESTVDEVVEDKMRRLEQKIDQLGNRLNGNE